MSKICGIIGKNLDPDQGHSILRRMTDLMKHTDGHRVDEWEGAHVALGHTSIGAVNPEPQPIFNEDHSKVIVFAGKIFAFEDLKRLLMEAGHRFRYPDNDAEFVLHLFEEHGTSKLKELNGIFSFCIWDKTKNELILANDRYGMRPMYYYFDEGQKLFLFGSEIKTITRQDFVNRQVDWDAWNVFLRFGSLIGEDTFYQNIHTLLQAGILRFDGDQIHLDTYWSFNDVKLRTVSDEKKDLENLIFLFKQSMKRRAVPNRRVAVLLSGGLDSRGIAAELKRQNASLVAFTTRKFSKVDSDRKVAQEVARKLNIDHEFCDLPDDFLHIQEPYKNYLLDFESDEHAWLLPLLDKVPVDIKINYDGIGNDTVCDPYLYTEQNQPYVDLLESRQYDDFIGKFFITKLFSFLPWDDEKNHFEAFSEKLRPCFTRERFLEKLRQILKKYNESTYISFQIATRSRRAVALAPFQLMLNRLESFCPYLDNDYFDYALGIPVKAKYNLSLRGKMLNLAYPELDGVVSKLSQNHKFDNKYVDHHDNYELLKLENLKIMAKTLLKSLDNGIFNRKYLLPRLLYASNLASLSYLGNGQLNKLLYHRSLYWLISPFYFLDSWLRSEKITDYELHENELAYV